MTGYERVKNTRNYYADDMMFYMGCMDNWLPNIQEEINCR